MWCCFLNYLTKNSRPEMFCKNAIRKNFAIFKGKHLSLFLIKLQVFGLLSTPKPIASTNFFSHSYFSDSCLNTSGVLLPFKYQTTLKKRCKRFNIVSEQLQWEVTGIFFVGLVRKRTAAKKYIFPSTYGSSIRSSKAIYLFMKSLVFVDVEIVTMPKI